MVGLFKHPKRKIKKLIKQGDYEDAIQLGKSLESEYSDDHDFMFIMGSVYFLVDEPKKALPYFEKAFQLNKNDIEMLRLKTNVHLALEQKSDAINCCEHILKIDPKNNEAHDLLDQLERL
ncbi:tetratricopeptide repeat protein [Nitrosopumilus sp.]|uniref:tetratricopeptide repeat protein n=1 Tax=Nitrosopumilus sp. TaxID=2024843 RepID=UPI003D0C336E